MATSSTPLLVLVDDGPIAANSNAGLGVDPVVVGAVVVVVGGVVVLVVDVEVVDAVVVVVDGAGVEVVDVLDGSTAVVEATVTADVPTVSDVAVGAAEVEVGDEDVDVVDEDVVGLDVVGGAGADGLGVVPISVSPPTASDVISSRSSANDNRSGSGDRAKSATAARSSSVSTSTNTAPPAIDPAMTAVAVRVVVATCPAWATACGTIERPRSSVSQPTKPSAARFRPMDALSNARTTAGSNWVPEQRTISRRAASGDIASL